MLPVALFIFIDLIIAALILLLFYFMTYVWRGETKPQPLPGPSAALSAAPSAAASTELPQETAQASPALSREPATLREKFADKFTGGEIEKTANTYKSANISVTVDTVKKDGVTYFLTDIYVADIKYFKTAFAKTPDVLGHEEHTDEIAREVGAVVAINGDYCLNGKQFIIRNGNLYPTHEKIESDILIMYNDGSMMTLSPEDADREKIISDAPYQVWAFGPMLLMDGQPMTQFNSPQEIAGSENNPRTAIGYYEPGHYCFLVVDGRQEGYSHPGYNCEQMSRLFFDLGCIVAYNLDGGQTAEIAFMGALVNRPYDGGRPTSDIIYIADE